METQVVKPKSIVEYLSGDLVRDNIRAVLGNKAQQFVASVASLVNSNAALQKCDPKSVMSACLVAATLDLPINPNLGFAFVIPYKDRATYQMGYKGYIQLAMRSGQYRTINVTDVREGELGETNRLTGEISFNWVRDGRDQLPIVGYVAYIELINGFRKTLYMTTDQLTKHAGRYSQSFKANSSNMNMWKEDFDLMAAKTVVKLLIAKYGPMSAEMQKAQLADQAVVNEDGGYEYVDNEPIQPKELAADKERARVIAHIEASSTIEELEKCELGLDEETTPIYDAKLNQLLDAKIQAEG